MRLNLSLFLILFIFSIHSALGQHFYCKNYTINDGLPDNNIQDIYKDSRGFLWIGTKAGLARFDGKNFKIYSSQDGISGDDVQSITESNDGCIWIACYDGGICKIEGDHIVNFEKENSLLSKQVLKIYFSKKYHLLFIVTENEIIKYDGRHFIPLQGKINKANLRLFITRFLEINNQIYVFTNGNGTYQINPNSNSLNLVSENNPLNSNLTYSAYIGINSDTLINFNRTGLKSISKNKTTIYEFNGQVSGYVEDADSNIWFTSKNTSYSASGGLYKYKNGRISDLTKNLNINSKNITAIEYDSKEDLLLIGTEDQGIYLYPKFNFSYFEANDFNLSKLYINDLQIDSTNKIWILTQNDLIGKTDSIFEVIKFDQFEREFKKFKQNQIKIKYSYLSDAEGSFEKYQKLIQSGKYKYSNPYIREEGNRYNILPEKSLYKPLKYDVLIHKELKELTSIRFDRKGNLWIGSNVGLFMLNKISKTLKYFDLDGTSFSNFNFGPNNELYASNWNDLLIYNDIENNSNYTIYNYYENNSPININQIKTHDNKIFFTSWDHGLFIMDGDKFHSSLNQKSLKFQALNDICFNNFGDIVLGGNNGEIFIVEYIGDSIRLKFEINKKNGIKGSSIRYLHCTNDNYLIAGTNNGINLINLRELYDNDSYSVITIDKEFGFTDYSGNDCVIDKQNQVWIGTQNQLIKFNYNQLKKPKDNEINFFIKSIEINDNAINFNDIKDLDLWTNVPKSVIELPYYKNSISLYFGVIKFIDPDKITFSYKLEGWQNKWIKETKERKVVFQNLRPGSYKLKIKAINEYKSEKNKELTISFLIAKPFWGKWWFISGSFAFVVLIIWLIIILRTRSIKKKERLRSELAERVTEFEMKALRSQMNPHFIFNAINSIQNYMLDNDVDAALGYLSDFAKLIRITLDNVSKKRISLDDELDYLKYYISLEQMRFNKSFEIKITLPKEHNSRTILIPPMIIQPFVENAIKHGFVYKKEGALIQLKFEVTKDEILKCIIEDNGIGRKKSRELNKNSKTHKSKGTFITNERLSLLNQTRQRKGYKINTIDLFDEFNIPCGTRVEIDIPI